MKSSHKLSCLVLLFLFLRTVSVFAQVTPPAQVIPPGGYNLTGTWIRDDGNPRTLENIVGGVKMDAEGHIYIYHQIAENVFRMDWTPRGDGGVYRWTFTVINPNTIINVYETPEGGTSTTRKYIKVVM